MAEPVLIVGPSGAGKTTSIEGFGENEAFLANVIGKRPPFKKKFKYVLNSDNVEKIKRTLEKMPDEVKVGIIDDAGYLMTNMFMQGHSGDKSGGNTFDLFNRIADSFWGLITFIKSLPEDKLIYIIMHEETNDFGQRRPKTIGKLLNEKVCIEGMCTVVLRAETVGGKYYFVTQNEGNDFAKSPRGMFSDIRIPNDLKAVDTAIREYWGLTPSTNTSEKGESKE